MMEGGSSDNRVKAHRITVRGLVQGVGFRPFVYRLAMRFGFRGEVENRTDGVVILLQDNGVPLEDFLTALRDEAPTASDIWSVSSEPVVTLPFDHFTIRESRHAAGEITEISPDIAVCKDCLEDMKCQPHRLDYPLINCTNCGPRFSIITALPYDRPSTTMGSFAMCDRCAAEYADIGDRRFHAQPVACNHCGPVYTLEFVHGETLHAPIRELVNNVALRIAGGETVAIKGTGGYHLICDALQAEAVSGLRERKRRDGKPLAVMFKDSDTVKEYAFLSAVEYELLTSWRRPVVLLRSKGKLPPLVNSNLDRVGAILPYMPLHHMLFEAFETPAIVFTSGNVSDEPVETDDRQARENLGNIAGSFLVYNREIWNRADDSVVKVIDGRPSLIRRSRGYVPKPVRLRLDVEGIFAPGAELKNTFCIGKGNQAILSQHIGDLQHYGNHHFYTGTAERFRDLFRFTPSLVASDLHPDYLSSRYAVSLGLPLEYVQHHHAHIASCMAEHHLDEPVTGLAFDGTGLGDDGHIWGSEVMIADLEGYQRIGHIGYIPLAGGDRAVEEPWRTALALLLGAYGEEGLDHASRLMPGVPASQLSLVAEALEKNINVHLSCGMGRFFDAAAALSGLCLAPTFDSEGPMLLEARADAKEKGFYPVELECGVLRHEPVIRAMTEDLYHGVPVGAVSARIHNTLAEFGILMASGIRKEHGIGKVVLSGGVFQNAFLVERIVKGLKKRNFTIFIQSQVPANDGGISLGQMAVASKRRM